MLCNLETQPPEAVAGGHGADEAEALMTLGTTLTPRTSGARPQNARWYVHGQCKRRNRPRSECALA